MSKQYTFKDPRFRFFKTADGSKLHAMIQLYYKEDHDHELPVDQIERTIQVLTAEPTRGAIVVFERGNGPIGYAILVNYWSNELGGNVLFIDELYVAPAARGQKLASDFISAIADSRLFNSVALQLETTAHNSKARNLYERLGFKQQGSIHMVKLLSVG